MTRPALVALLAACLTGCAAGGQAPVSTGATRSTAQHLTLSGAFAGVVTEAQPSVGGCGTFTFPGVPTMPPDPGVSALPDEAVQYDAVATAGDARIHLTIQVDPFLGPRSYAVSAPLDPGHLPPPGSQLAFAVLHAGGSEWRSRPGPGTIAIDPDGAAGHIDADLVAGDAATPILHLSGRFSCSSSVTSAPSHSFRPRTPARGLPPDRLISPAPVDHLMSTGATITIPGEFAYPQGVVASLSPPYPALGTIEWLDSPDDPDSADQIDAASVNPHGPACPGRCLFVESLPGGGDPEPYARGPLASAIKGAGGDVSSSLLSLSTAGGTAWGWRFQVNGETAERVATARAGRLYILSLLAPQRSFDAEVSALAAVLASLRVPR